MAANVRKKGRETVVSAITAVPVLPGEIYRRENLRGSYGASSSGPSDREAQAKAASKQGIFNKAFRSKMATEAPLIPPRSPQDEV